jgi:hypothetical protein
MLFRDVVTACVPMRNIIQYFQNILAHFSDVSSDFTQYLELRHIRVSEFTVWLCATNGCRNSSVSGKVLFVSQNSSLTKFFSTVLAAITDFGVFPSAEIK